MINEQDRESLITYRIEQAKDTIDLSDFLIKSEKLTVAVNRIYYAMYYALTALALKNSYETSKHSQLIGWFNKEYVSTSRVDKKYGRILRNAFRNRSKGDYDAFIIFIKQDVLKMQEEMIDFIEIVDSLLKE